ncbi:hypothetical protein N7470_007239 [Penicillium chermesinum]|nr:hypothetical protein N7470_007239 [Penicillium chermesinum]
MPSAILKVDLISDRNNIRKLLSFINPKFSRSGLEPFTIEVEVIGNTAVFCRAETKTYEFIGPNEFRGYGHEFEKAFTKPQVPGSTGHHRVVSYNLGGLKFVVRYETDAYDGEDLGRQREKLNSEEDSILNVMQSLSLSRHGSHSRATVGSKLVVQKTGKEVPPDSTLEIKTRVSHKHLSIQEVLPQLWVSQTPRLVRAYHNRGTFAPPQVEHVTHEIAEWKKAHEHEIRGLVVLVEEVLKVVKEHGRNAVIK